MTISCKSLLKLLHCRLGKRSNLMLGFALMLCGCSTILPVPNKYDSELAKHHILVHEEGYPFKIDRGMLLDTAKELTASEFEAQIEKILTPLDELAKSRAKSNQPLRILLFTHGGLNSYRADHRRMLDLMIADNGALNNKNTSYYPIFVNWNSDLFDSLFDDIFLIRQGRRNFATGPITFPFTLASRLASTILGAPRAWLNGVDNYKDGIISAQKDGFKPEDIALDALVTTLLVPIKAVEIPILEALGTGAWQVMRRRVELAVASRLETEEHALNPFLPHYTKEGAARTLIKKLQTKIATLKNNHENLDVEVTLVGHSMGAMLVNRILTLTETLPVKRVVYLGAAARIDDFEQSALPFLNTPRATGQNKPIKPEAWWFTLTRTDEALDTHFIIEPKGSLLAWIDNYFEPIGTLGQSTLGRQRNLDEYYTNEWLDGKADENGVIRFKNDDPRYKNIMLRKTTLSEANEPRSHGDYDDNDQFRKILCRVDPNAFNDHNFCLGKK